MKRFDINSNLVTLNQSYISGRTFRVKRFGELATTPERASVPQGSLLGSELFTLFTSDLPRLLHTNLTIYADITCLFTISRDDALFCPGKLDSTATKRHYIAKLYAWQMSYQC